MATEEKRAGKERIQPATRDEQWDDERLRGFLELEPPADMPADYHILLKAYRAMTPEFFARFIPIFVENGHDPDVRLEDGSRFIDHLRQHRRAGPYIEALRQAGVAEPAD